MRLRLGQFEPPDSFERLAREAIGPALDALADSGTFQPYLVLLISGDAIQFIHHDSARVAAGCQPLLERLAQTANDTDCVASAIIYDALTESGDDVDAADAIALALRSHDGAEQLALIPYSTAGTEVLPGKAQWLRATGPAFQTWS